MSVIEIKYHRQAKDVEVNLPYSKSILNRIQIINFLSTESNKLDLSAAPDDSGLLQLLLNEIKNNKKKDLVELNANDAGTVMRFLVSLLAIVPGKWKLTGSNRMQERPIGPLVDALRSIGAEITYLNNNGFPPLLIQGKNLKGGHIKISGKVSSQFISSLMLIGPMLENGLRLNIQDEIVSEPYIQMTYRVMKDSNINLTYDANNIWISRSDYVIDKIPLERDWSSAVFWYEKAVFSDDEKFFLKGLHQNDIQGDKYCSALFKKLGVATEFHPEGILIRKIQIAKNKLKVDLKDYPDIAPSFIVACAAMNIPAVVNNISHLKYKESDRGTIIARELNALGFNVSFSGDTFQIMKGKHNESNHIINPEKDHRIIMSFVPLAMILGSIEIRDYYHTSKSYPYYWTELEKAGFSIYKKHV